MKPKKDHAFKTETDIKIFLLYILDRIAYPLEYELIMSIIAENTGDISFDYGECLRRLADDGYLIVDSDGDDLYYSVSDRGRELAAELYGDLDPVFLERSLKAAIQYISLTDRGNTINAYITETESRMYRVTMEAHNRFGEVMSLSIAVNSESEAITIRDAYLAKPDGVYRGVLFAVTGRFDFVK